MAAFKKVKYHPGFFEIGQDNCQKLTTTTSTGTRITATTTTVPSMTTTTATTTTTTEGTPSSTASTGKIPTAENAISQTGEGSNEINGPQSLESEDKPGEGHSNFTTLVVAAVIILLVLFGIFVGVAIGLWKRRKAKMEKTEKKKPATIRGKKNTPISESSTNEVSISQQKAKKNEKPLQTTDSDQPSVVKLEPTSSDK